MASTVSQEIYGVFVIVTSSLRTCCSWSRLLGQLYESIFSIASTFKCLLSVSQRETLNPVADRSAVIPEKVVNALSKRWEIQGKAGKMVLHEGAYCGKCRLIGVVGGKRDYESHSRAKLRPGLYIETNHQSVPD